MRVSCEIGMRLLVLRLNKSYLIFSGSPLPEPALDKVVGRKSTLRSTAGRLSLRSSPIPQTPADYTYTHIHTYWLQTITHTDTSLTPDPTPPSLWSASLTSGSVTSAAGLAMVRMAAVWAGLPPLLHSRVSVLCAFVLRCFFFSVLTLYSPPHGV